MYTVEEIRRLIENIQGGQAHANLQLLDRRRSSLRQRLVCNAVLRKP